MTHGMLCLLPSNSTGAHPDIDLDQGLSSSSTSSLHSYWQVCLSLRREEEEHQGKARAAQSQEEGPCGCDYGSCQKAHARGVGSGWRQTRPSCSGVLLALLAARTAELPLFCLTRKPATSFFDTQENTSSQAHAQGCRRNLVNCL